MSEVLVEHPVLFIEKLLKLGIGDKGRLLYLRNALTKGTKIHDSDKKFLKKMQQELDKSRGLKLEKPDNDVESDSFKSKNSSLSDSEPKISNHKKNSIDEKNKNLKESNSDLLKIQIQLSEIKQRDSKLMDNLELLFISHEGLSQPKIEDSNSLALFPRLLQGKSTELFDSVKRNLKFKKF